MTPTNAAATRSAHFAELCRGRGAGYVLGLGVVAGLLIGAALRSPLIMAAAPVGVIVLVLLAAHRAARQRAASDFYNAFAAGHGLEHWREWHLPPLTPLLGAGDRRRWEHFMEGPLSESMPDLKCGLGLYTYQTRGGTDEDPNARWRSHHFTVCVVDMEEAIAMYPALFLQRRRDLVGRLTEEEWLDRHGRYSVELESIAFGERYELLVDHHQDRLLLRELFSPSFIVYLAGHPLAPCFEYRAGALVVYVRRRLGDAGSLNMLLDAARHMASRLREEVSERPRTAVPTA